LHGQRSVAIREEWAYFVNCVQKGEKPDIITPEESLEAVSACLAQKRSAERGIVVQVLDGLNQFRFAWLIAQPPPHGSLETTVPSD